MKGDRRWGVAALLILALLAPACREEASAGSDGGEPVTLEPIEGTDLTRVVLTERAAARIGIETAAVGDVGSRLAVPESAVWVDVNGDEWVYMTHDSLMFLREAITVVRYDGGLALLSDGPAAGTQVVTVGVAELIGSEFGI